MRFAFRRRCVTNIPLFCPPFKVDNDYYNTRGKKHYYPIAVKPLVLQKTRKTEMFSLLVPLCTWMMSVPFSSPHDHMKQSREVKIHRHQRFHDALKRHPRAFWPFVDKRSHPQQLEVIPHMKAILRNIRSSQKIACDLHSADTASD